MSKPWQKYPSQIDRFRREGLATGRILPQDTEAVLEHYKEPLRPNPTGFGFAGTVAVNREQTHIQCSECGYFVRDLAAHARRQHALSSDQYRLKFGLSNRTSLNSPQLRVQRIADIHLRGLTDPNSPGQLAIAEWRRKLASGEVVNKQGGRHKKALSDLNLEGTCPDQLVDKIKRTAKKLGHVPTAHEWEEDWGINRKIVTERWGSWTRAVNEAGFKTVRESKNLSDEEILGKIRAFYLRTGRPPYFSDFRNHDDLPCTAAIYSHFGSMNAARGLAGVPLVHLRGRGRWVVDEPVKPRGISAAQVHEVTS